MHAGTSRFLFSHMETNIILTSIMCMYVGDNAADKVAIKPTPKLPTGFAKINQVSSGSPAHLAVSYMYRYLVAVTNNSMYLWT